MSVHTVFAAPLSKTADVYFPAALYAAPSDHVSPSGVPPVLPPNMTPTSLSESHANPMYWRGAGGVDGNSTDHAGDEEYLHACWAGRDSAPRPERWNKVCAGRRAV